MKTPVMPVVELDHGDSSSIEHCTQGKKTRGPNRLLKVRKLPVGEKLKVDHNYLGQPIGENASTLSKYMGFLVRDGCLAPLTYKSWKQMPMSYKKDLQHRVKEKFDIDKSTKRWMLKTLGKQWREWKCTLKREHFDIHETYERQLEDCDSRVVPSQWVALVEYWNSDEGKQLCKQNKNSRAKQKCPHTLGSKSLARVREEMMAEKEDESEPSRLEVFMRTHMRSGQYVDETSARIAAECMERLAHLDRRGDDMAKDDTFAQVVGEDQPGHVRTYGLGPTPSDFFGLCPTKVELIKRATAAEKKIKNLEKKIEKLQKDNEQLAAENRQLRANLQGRSSRVRH
ncbi:uncharacterized protein LOC116250131 isoform X2 [Nymphaea colorata]|uniref:uncharacterized protein LOC116250131 isoform X2 n=1 Tax=Nymphaea colorata TaxID=210225 RepID=UPI00129E9A1B|nr:uncharacterized protein LOC116250131 isoform X2 [Nymphaea colorata]